MDNTKSNQNITQAERHYARVMAFAVFVLFFVGIGCIGFYLHHQQVLEQQAITPVTHSATSTQIVARSEPIHLRIPALKVDTDFVAPLTLNADKTVSVPDSYEKVGWYEGGATPGEVGPAVILGHVDSYKGPAVFYSLGQLKEGDEIIIDRADGTTTTFVVSFFKRYSQDAFPTVDVYGPTQAPTLRLVTCSGIYNKGTQRYDHNLVVYAILKSILNTK